MSIKSTSFTQTLGNLRHGETLQEIDELLTDALQASEDTVDYIKNGKANTFADGEPVEISPGVHSFVTVLEGSAT